MKAVKRGREQSKDFRRISIRPTGAECKTSNSVKRNIKHAHLKGSSTVE